MPQGYAHLSSSGQAFKTSCLDRQIDIGRPSKADVKTQGVGVQNSFKVNEPEEIRKVAHHPQPHTERKKRIKKI